MAAKLTLRMDQQLIERAKRYARSRGIPLSRLVADYFALLDLPRTKAERAAAAEELPPITRSLLGALAGSNLDEDEYGRHLEEKYG